MSKQYHFWPAVDGAGFDAWDVDRLLDLTTDFKVKAVPVDAIWEIDTDYWSDATTEPTVRRVLVHMRAVLDVDMSQTIILGHDGRVMDGMHRSCRAILNNETTINAVQFDVHPDPDVRNCNPSISPPDLLQARTSVYPALRYPHPVSPRG